VGKAQRDKGGRVERKVVSLLRSEGIAAERVPLSGAAGGSFSGDIALDLPALEDTRVTAEVKARKGGEGFKQLERWLGDNDLLFLARDRKKPLVVMPFSLFADLATGDVPKGTWDDYFGVDCEEDAGDTDDIAPAVDAPQYPTLEEYLADPAAE
jgi:hypothetical protein